MAIANITGNILTDSGISTSSLLPLSGGTITGFLTSSKSITTGENGQISIIPSTNTSAAFLQVTNSDGTTYFGKNNNSGSYLGSSPNATLVYSTGSSPIMLYTNGNMIMTLTGGTPSVGGNVLINTTSDNGAKLQVSGSATFSSSLTIGSTFNITTEAWLQFLGNNVLVADGDFTILQTSGTGLMRFRNNSAQNLLTLANNGTATFNSNDANGWYGGFSNSGTNFAYIGATLQFANSGGTATDFGIRSANAIAFYTSGGNERMRITSAGLVGIGTVNSFLAQLNVGRISAGATTRALSLYNNSSNVADTGVAIEFYPNTGNDDRCAKISSVNTSTVNNADLRFFTSNDAAPVERMRITSGGVINTTSRLNVNGAGDNSLFSFINNGTTYTLGFSPNATASTSTTLTITTATTTWIYNGTGTATWTLPNPSGTNQMFWIKNAGTGVLTLNAFSGTNIINNSATAVSSITIAVGATALIQQDGNIRSYQLQ